LIAVQQPVPISASTEAPAGARRLQRRQALARHVFHRNRRRKVVFDEIVDPHDVLVGQVKAAVGLTL
jgi:hypothetical protein